MLQVGSVPILMAAATDFEAETTSQEAAQHLSDLYDCHKNFLFSLALSISGNRQDAEDAIQLVFQKVWKDRMRWDRIKEWRSWLARLTRNTILDHLKQVSRRRIREEKIATECFLEPTDETDSEHVEKLHLTLRKLDEPLRTIIFLKMFQELTFKEIGGVIQISASTASTRYYEAIKKLRNLWEEEA